MWWTALFRKPQKFGVADDDALIFGGRQNTADGDLAPGPDSPSLLPAASHPADAVCDLDNQSYAFWAVNERERTDVLKCVNSETCARADIPHSV